MFKINVFRIQIKVHGLLIKNIKMITTHNNIECQKAIKITSIFQIKRASYLASLKLGLFVYHLLETASYITF